MFVPSRLGNVRNLNYDFWSQIFRDQLGTMSWSGCVNTSKRNVLCRIPCLFHQLPADVPDKQIVPLQAKAVEHHWRVKCCIVSQWSKRFQLAGFKYWCWREHYDIWAAPLTTKDIWLHLINSIGHCLNGAQDSPKRNSLALLLLKSVTWHYLLQTDFL